MSEQVFGNKTEPRIVTDKRTLRAFEQVEAGGLIIIPADIGFGILGRSDASIKRMYEAKRRPLSNPVIIPGNIDLLRRLNLNVCAEILDWVESISQSVTLAVVFSVNESDPLIASMEPFVRQQAVSSGSVAMFLNPGTFVSDLTALCLSRGFLCVGSSGNLSGRGNNYRAEDLPQELKAAVDYWFTDGTAKYENAEKRATTIVNLDTLHISRVGVCHEQIVESYAAHFAELPGFPNDLREG